jgi:hypothetical protein
MPAGPDQGDAGAHPDRLTSWAAASLRCEHKTDVRGRPITVPLIIAVFLIAIVALAIVGFSLHLIFSPWLIVVGIGVLAWIKLRRRHSRR